MGEMYPPTAADYAADAARTAGDDVAKLRRRVEALEDGGVPMIGLRDWFAGQVIGAAVQSGWSTLYADGMARHAYDIADAMMKARER